ncbi:organic hydroperoxide resistance protein [Promicromonospora alba]|uniref:Organic hydroperoxide resistance protein n=1 Tax=Promicromonospora alba TaxID=1616110 RepID=A0ABV9HL84_9MICO
MSDVLYTAEALSTGLGRDGQVRSVDGLIDLKLAVPEALGGPGGAANLEVLFASGYAACFHSALLGVARKRKASVTDTSVGSRVNLLPDGQGGYMLSVELEVNLPGMAHEQAQALADEAHGVCPYSNATRGNIDVTITVVDD